MESRYFALCFEEIQEVGSIRLQNFSKDTAGARLAEEVKVGRLKSVWNHYDR